MNAATVLFALALAFAAAQAPAPQQGLDPKAQQIQDLKRSADRAEKAGHLDEAIRDYDRILDLNPDDATARDLRARLTNTLKEQETAAENARKAKLAGDNARGQISRYLLLAHQKLDDPAPRRESALAGAAEALKSAREAAKAANLSEFDADFDRLEQQIAIERSRQNELWWEYWGGIGVVVLAALVGGFLLLWRRARTLEMLQGPTPGQMYALRHELTRVGALASEVEWAIIDPQRKISRHHCDVVRSGRHYFVVDRSTNGTFVNGRPLPKGEPVLLKRGDLIGLGDITLRFR